MKCYLPYTLWLLLLLCACGNRQTQTVAEQKKVISTGIKGDFHLNDSQEIFYSIAGRVLSGESFIDTIRIDSSGSFYIDIDTEEPVFVTIHIPGIPFFNKKNELLSLIVVPIIPGQVLHLADTIEGYNRYIQSDSEVVNCYLHFPYTDYWHDFYNLSPDELIQHTVAMKEKDITVIYGLRKDGKINQQLYDLMLIDRECYYSFLINYMLKVKNIEEPFYYLPDHENWEKSPSWYNYVRQWIGMKYNTILLDETDQDLTISHHAYTLQEASKILSGKRLQHFNSVYLLQEISPGERYEKEVLDLYEQFVKAYPQSELTPFLQQTIQEVQTYYDKTYASLKESIHILKNNIYTNSTFEEIIEPFKGKKIYITIWDTNDTHSKQEFEKINKVYNWQKKYDYELIYICSGRDLKDWFETIIKYDLRGTHVRTHILLPKELKEATWWMAHRELTPWYIEVDEDGNILDPDAAPLSIRMEKGK